jgi:hypothetical protein
MRPLGTTNSPQAGRRGHDPASGEPDGDADSLDAGRTASRAPKELRTLMSNTLLATVVFLDGQEATSEHETPEDIGTAVQRIVKDLTDEKTGKRKFLSITIIPLEEGD